jgi:hypothetical protein
MEFGFPGVLPEEPGGIPWWFGFHQTPNLPEDVIKGNEREYISWFLKGLAYNPSVITEEDIDVYAYQISAPGGASSEFEYYRAFLVDAEQNKELVANGKITSTSSKR